ncbi:GNAT family N-acetyltransferase [Rubrivivax gelatinosus]|uniref:GNAT family N-acetyltransferase n=1 Tax=Rubrivivax gelatinosus TaxID=28068 RepID=UPI0019039417|nr:GNAT family protein [Rubrivivax gelatinosus]
MSAFIATEIPGCVLRPWRHGDAPALVRHGDDRRVWRNLTERFPHPYTAQDADSWIDYAAEPGPSLHLAIDWQGEAVGGIGLIALEDPVDQHTADFGYWLGHAVWGRGLATAAARALAAHALALPRWQRLQARVYAWNPASMRVLEKAGFEREGVLRRSICKDGELTDAVLYARLRAG